MNFVIADLVNSLLSVVTALLEIIDQMILISINKFHSHALIKIAEVLYYLDCNALFSPFTLSVTLLETAYPPSVIATQ